MKINYALAALLGCAGVMTASADNKLDLRSQHQLVNQYKVSPTRLHTLSMDTQAKAVGSMGVIITLTTEYAVDELKSAGINVEANIGRRAVAHVSAEQLDLLQQLDCVELISLSRTLKVDNDLMRAAGNVDDVHSGAGLNKAYTGEGVIVGLYDSGLQPNHINFLDEEGKSRVQRLFVYDMMQNTTGEFYAKESTYDTPAKIAEFDTENNDGTHGTHVLGIAAGSYRGGDNDYSGVAPGADIAIACGWTDETAIITGLSRLITYANSQNKPIAINLSLGDIMGPHDGTDAFAAALDEIAATTPLMISSGNSGDLDIALIKTLNSDGDNVMRTTIAGNAALAELNKTIKGKRWDAQATIEIYASDNRPFKIQAGLVDKTTGEFAYALEGVESGFVRAANAATGSAGTVTSEFLNTYYTDSYISIATGVAENNRYLATVNLNLLKKAPFNNNVIPAIVITGAGGTQRVDLHTDSSYNVFSDSNIEGWDDATTDGSNNNLTCGKNVIGVGAYTTRIIAPYEFGELGTVAPFSGSMTMLDGTTRPHVCAPGHAIISSMNTSFRKSKEYSRSQFPIMQEVTKDSKTYYWVPISGTSMAAPVVTGTVALWLQANPELTPAQIKDIAMKTAQAPEVPSVRWGAGRIDALAGLKLAIDMNSVSNILAEPSKLMIDRQGDTFRVMLPGRDSFDAEVYNMHGVRVATVSGNDGEASVDLSGYAHGIYIIRAGGTATRVVR